MKPKKQPAPALSQMIEEAAVEEEPEIMRASKWSGCRIFARDSEKTISQYYCYALNLNSLID